MGLALLQRKQRILSSTDEAIIYLKCHFMHVIYLVIVEKNEFGDPSSNPGRDYLRFTWCLWGMYLFLRVAMSKIIGQARFSSLGEQPGKEKKKIECKTCGANFKDSVAYVCIILLQSTYLKSVAGSRRRIRWLYPLQSIKTSHLK